MRSPETAHRDSTACSQTIPLKGRIVDLPLRDEEIWVDRQIGFDWLAVMRALLGRAASDAQAIFCRRRHQPGPGVGTVTPSDAISWPDLTDELYQTWREVEQRGLNETPSSEMCC